MVPDPHGSPLVLRALRGLIRLFARLAPARARADWQQEWFAEIDHRWSRLQSRDRLDWRAKADLFRRASGAALDAAWLRRQFTADAEWVHDIRHGLRLLRSRPAFSLTAAATLAVGIGANTAVFTLVDATLLRRLPYEDPDRIVTIWERRGGPERDEVAPANFLDWRARARSFDVLAAADPYAYDYTDGAEPESLFAIRVTEGFFRAAGARPFIGRAFAASDFTPGREQVAILSHALWQRLFGGDPAVVGRPIRLDAKPFTIVGVMPADFSLRLLQTAGERGLWTPKIFEDFERRGRAAGYWNAIGRLKPGVTLAAAQAELDAISAQLAREYPRTNARTRAEIVPLRQHLTGDVRLPFLTMLAAVAVVLTIACANVSAMTLARGMQRGREFAIRAALGAARARIVRQLLTEAFALAVLAAIAGLALAHAALRVAIARAPAGMPPLTAVAIDRRALAFTIGVTLATALMVALVPALRISSARADAALRDRAGASGPHGRRTRGVLIAGEVALATVLLIAAGLLLRSFVRLVSVDPGFTRANVAVLQLFVYDRHDTPEQKRAFFTAATERLRGVAGVQDVGAVSALPFIPANIGIRSGMIVHGRPAPPPGEQPNVYVTVATPSYFDVLRIPHREGRRLSEDDGPRSARAAVINELLRKRHWPEGNAIGQRVSVRFEGKVTELEIVGVTGDLRHDGFDRGARPEIFIPFAQQPFGSMTFVVRTAGDAAAALPELRRQVWAVDPLQTFYQTATMDALVDDTVSARRFSAAIIAGFALIALALAATGIYALISMSTAQRTQEIGVRMALGADRGRILLLIVGEGLVFVAAGLAVGVLAALGVTRALTRLLFGVTPADPGTFATAALLLAGAGLAATYLPARRATRVDPLVALRAE